MLTCQEIERTLDQYHGSENFHFNSSTKPFNIVYTDGIKAMAEMCQSWWLIDAICSQQKKCMKNPNLQNIQFWTFTKKEKTPHILKCEIDSGKSFLTQEIEYTDFPLSSVRIWLEADYMSMGKGPQRVMVMMLPSER